jgi:flagellar basal body-associated protein FliL
MRIDLEIIVIMVVAGLLMIGAVIGLGVWTYRDAKARGLEAGLWTAIVVAIPNFIGLLVYFLVGRKQQQVLCSACGRETQSGKLHCFNCGALLVPLANTEGTRPRNTKRPLVLALICVILTFMMVGGVLVSRVWAEPEMFSAHNIAIGQTQTDRPGIWKLSFWYLDGEKVRAIKIKQGEPQTLSIDAKIKKGTVKLGIKSEGREEELFLLNGQESAFEVDLSKFPADGKITVHLYADQAKGSVNMKW